MIEKQLARLAGHKKTAAAPSREAKLLIENPATSAVALLPAVKSVIGDDFLAWEPETLWLELEHHKIDVPLENRDKLQAVVALNLVPSFYWDGIVFEKTALAFDDVPTNADLLQEASPEQLAWAVKEASWIRTQLGETVPEFIHEPSAYTAVVCHRAGLVVAPEQLTFCQTMLDTLNPHSEELRKSVRAGWDTIDKNTIGTHSFAFTETEKDVQLARLVAIELHVRDHETRASSDLSRL